MEGGLEGLKAPNPVKNRSRIYRLDFWRKGTFLQSDKTRNVFVFQSILYTFIGITTYRISEKKTIEVDKNGKPIRWGDYRQPSYPNRSDMPIYKVSGPIASLGDAVWEFNEIDYSRIIDDRWPDIHEAVGRLPEWPEPLPHIVNEFTPPI